MYRPTKVSDSLIYLDAILDSASKSYIYPMIATALHTGMKKSELFNLKWTDVDFEHRIVTVQSKEDWQQRIMGQEHCL